MSQRRGLDRARALSSPVLLAALLAALTPRASGQDCDGNGIPDLEELTAALTFASQGDFGIPVGFNTFDLATGDLNGDGTIDLVVLNEEGGSPVSNLVIILGNPDGTLQRGLPFLLTREDGYSSVALADFDGDGVLDLLTAGGTNFWSGDGIGTFRSPRNTQSNAAGDSPAAFIDLNADGNLDTVGVGGTDSVYVGFGNGRGRIVRDEYHSVGQSPQHSLVADVNGDGRPDILTSNARSGDLSVLLGTGDGSFEPERRVPASASPGGLALGDVNSDGRADIVVVDTGSGQVTEFIGSGDGGFAPGRSTLGLLSSGGDVAIADLNGDGRDDVVVGQRENLGAISVVLGNGDGTWQAPRDFPCGAFPFRLAVVDLNRDGRLDIATLNRTGDLTVLLGTGTGEFLAPPRTSVGREPRAIAVGDLDGDGHADVVTSNVGSDDVSVLLGSGDGSFSPERRYPAGDSPASLALADISGDGIPDAATANNRSNDVSILFGDGHGGFLAQQHLGVGARPLAVALADVDGDEHVDIATANYDSRDVSLLLGDGTGAFAAERRLPISARPELLSLADIDGDGAIDVVAAGRGSGVLHVLPGGQDGSFAPERLVDLDPTASFSMSAFVVADINSDGRPDVAAAGFEGFGLVLLGDDQGSLTLADSFGVGSRVFRLLVEDLDADGALDVAAANNDTDDVSVVLGNGDGSFRAPRRFMATYSPWALASGDFDDDGRVDLAVADSSVSSVAVLLNRRIASGTDCNDNAVLDACDIASGSSLDCNGSEVPDECEPTLEDRVPPTIRCLESIDVECAGNDGAVVGFSAPVEDACDPEPGIVCTPPPGSLFPVGTTVVRCVATDASGNRAECTFEVRVRCMGGQVPGDCNQDGALDISDPVCVFRGLFVEGLTGPCGGGGSGEPANLALLDWNNDRRLDISDGIGALQFLFARGRAHVLGDECLRLRTCPDLCAF